MSEEIKDINADESTLQVENSSPEVAAVDEVQESTDDLGWTAEFEDYPKEDKEVEETPEEVSDEEPKQEDVQDIVEEPVQEVESTIEVEKIEEETVSEESVLQELSTSTSEVESSNDYPEFIQNLIKFHEETGGDLNDYQTINLDYSKLDEDELVRKHLKAENPDFTDEEITWEMEDKFGVDEYADEDSREYKKAVLNKKRAVANAQKHFDGMKEKYASNLKSEKEKASIPQEYQEAYAAQQAALEQASSTEAWNNSFKDQTAKQFENFNGFVFDTGEGKFRIRESNFANTASAQSDFNILSKEHLDDSGNVKDLSAYHKAMYAARNADKLAKHFYNQGKADALTERAKSTKNIDMEPKTQKSTPSSGTKYEFL